MGLPSVVSRNQRLATEFSQSYIAPCCLAQSGTSVVHAPSSMSRGSKIASEQLLHTDLKVYLPLCIFLDIIAVSICSLNHA